MPKESRELMEPGETLLGICLEVHGVSNGSVDIFDSVRNFRNTDILKVSVDKWEDGCVFGRKFDAAVLGLIKATLEEAEAIGITRGEWICSKK